MEFEIYKGRLNEWRWRLRAANGKIIADSGEGYVNKADCERGILLVAGTSNTTPVQEEASDAGLSTILGATGKTTVGHLALKHR